MKNHINLTLLLLTVGCFSQSPIINIINKDGTRITGAYYQDSNNLLDTYQGIWLYTNGTTSLKIILKKVVQQYNGRYYEDLIIGEYQYINNGIEKINTLNEIDNIYSNQRIHNIDANSFISKTNKPQCLDCAQNEKRLSGGFEDHFNNTYGSIVIRKIIQFGQEAIKIKTRKNGPLTYFQEEPVVPDDFTIPAGNYILIKQ